MQFPRDYVLCQSRCLYYLRQGSFSARYDVTWHRAHRRQMLQTNFLTKHREVGAAADSANIGDAFRGCDVDFVRLRVPEYLIQTPAFQSGERQSSGLVPRSITRSITHVSSLSWCSMGWVLISVSSHMLISDWCDRFFVYPTDTKPTISAGNCRSNGNPLRPSPRFFPNIRAVQTESSSRRHVAVYARCIPRISNHGSRCYG